MKATVVKLEQGREHIAKRKEEASREKLIALVQDIWSQAVARIEAEIPDAAVVAAQFDILQLPNRWWSSSWSAKLQKLYYRDESGKKHRMRDNDFYEDFAGFRADTANKYRAMAKKKAK